MSNRTKTPINRAALSFGIHGGVLGGALWLIPASPLLGGTIVVVSAVGMWASWPCKDPRWVDAMRARSFAEEKAKYHQGRY